MLEEQQSKEVSENCGWPFSEESQKLSSGYLEVRETTDDMTFPANIIYGQLLDITWPYHVTGSALSVVGPSLSHVRQRGTRCWTVFMTRCSAATATLQIRPRNTAADGPSLAAGAWAHEVQAVHAHAPLPYWSGAGAAIFDRAGSACRQYCSSSPALGVICWPCRSFHSPFNHRWPCIRCCRSTTAYCLTFKRLRHHSTRLRNIWNPTSLNCLSLVCRACDYVYIDYVRRSRSSSYCLLHPINCQIYITLHYITASDNRWRWICFVVIPLSTHSAVEMLHDSVLYKSIIDIDIWAVPTSSVTGWWRERSEIGMWCGLVVHWWLSSLC